MRKVFILLLFLVPTVLYSQQDANNYVEKPQRKVYLWDVTLSMKGAGGCPNIWQDVKENLIKDIKSITDPKTEIVLLPFQHRIIEKKSDYATAEGKQNLIQYVRDFDLPKLWIGDASTGHEAKPGEKGKTTMTKLYAPLQECLETVITVDKTDILVFFTDGLSDFPEDGAKFERFVCEDWCSGVAEEKDIYAYYLMLTSKATNTRTCGCPPRFKKIDPTEKPDLSTVTLTPASKVCYNVKDDYGKDIVVKFDTKSSTPMEAGFVIHVENDSVSPYFDINQDVVLDPVHNTISIHPKLKMTSEEMRSHIFENAENKDSLYLSYTTGKGMDEKYDRVIIRDVKTEIEMVGTDERTLKLEWK
jgi:hypothetical protein